MEPIFHLSDINHEMPDLDAETGEGGETAAGGRRNRSNGRGNDLSRLSQSGESLYLLLDIPKTSTEQV